jgi:hypothetical protein
MAEPASEKKIIIDEDWKEQAQREKEMLAAAMEREKQAQHQPPPEASFPLLITSLATQAFLSLGEMEHPLTKKVELNLGEAQFHIDMIEMLQEKTKGNLTPQEAQMVQGILFDLRMRFVAKTKA